MTSRNLRDATRQVSHTSHFQTNHDYDIPAMILFKAKEQ